jgi:hypothetical protein
MSQPLELYCTQDPDSQQWLVWFPHPLGGMKVLEMFDTESEARVYWQQQIDSADLGE